MKKYTQQELKKLFETLPLELKRALLSEETANYISAIGKRYKLGEKNPFLAEKVGEVLLGLLSPKQMLQDLEKTLKIDSEKAEKISREINRFIFFPVKESLQQFYKEIQFAPGGRIIKTIPKKPASIISEENLSSKKDIYREPIE